MLVADFDYDLPEGAVAKFPPRVRGATRLLVLGRGGAGAGGDLKAVGAGSDGGALGSSSGATGVEGPGGSWLTDSRYVELAEWLRPGDLVILNDTKVMRARVFAKLLDGRERELVVLEGHGGDLGERVDKGREDLDEGRGNLGERRAKVLYRGKLREGDVLEIGEERVKVVDVLGGGVAEIEIESGTDVGSGAQELSKNSPITITELMERYGTVPLPPYLKREAEAGDVERYQTVWARHLGSAAAPTASLNMTEGVLSSLREKGVEVGYLTLHVGLGTFLPMRTERVEEHRMHSEFFRIPEETVAAVERARARGGRVVAVGTTVARTLEFWGQTGRTEGEDDIFIYPGFKFGVVDCLLTNFHAPGSTVLMLAAAFAGSDARGGEVGDDGGVGWERLKFAYDYALAHGYKFLSYGDSMLIC